MTAAKRKKPACPGCGKRNRRLGTCYGILCVFHQRPHCGPCCKALVGAGRAGWPV